MGDARVAMDSVLKRNSTELNIPEETTLKRNSRGRTSLDLRDVTTLARLNYENEGISPLRQLREFNHTIQRTHSRTQPKSAEKTDDNKQSTDYDDNTVSSDSNENLRNKERRKIAVIPNGFNISRGVPLPPVILSVDSPTMDLLPAEDFPPPDPELLENLDLEKSLKRDIPGVLQIPDKYGHLRTPEEEEKRDDRIIYNMTSPKPVIPVRLSREVTSSKYMPPKRGIVRISKSSENILSDSMQPPESNTLTNRSDYHSAEDVLDQKPCSSDRTDLEVYQQAVKQIEPIEKTAIKSITCKYDSVQRRQLHALSFHDSEKSDMSSIGDVDVFETSPHLGEEHAPNVMTESVITVSDMARIELFYQSQGAEVFVCGCAADLLIQGKDGSSEYTHVNVGIPVLVLTTGQKRGQKRELRILLAEKETGFQLWGDNINYLSNYTDESPKVHTLCLSSNHTKTAAFHMHSVSAAAEFLAKFRDISADPNDELWKVGKTKKSKSKPRISLVSNRKGKKKLNKSDISQPCNFLHVTKVEPIDACAQGQTDQSFSADFRSRCNTSEW